MAGKRHLDRRREDAHARMPACRRREHERALREAHLARQRLHEVVIQATRVREDRELVAGEGLVGEDVADDVADRAHARL